MPFSTLGTFFTAGFDIQAERDASIIVISIRKARKAGLQAGEFKKDRVLILMPTSDIPVIAIPRIGGITGRNHLRAKKAYITLKYLIAQEIVQFRPTSQRPLWHILAMIANSTARRSSGSG